MLKNQNNWRFMIYFVKNYSLNIAIYKFILIHVGYNRNFNQDIHL